MKKNDPIIAINFVLDPDAAMLKFAKVVNKTLFENFPSGFVFDKTHYPHITLLQCYVYKSDLKEIYKLASKILDERDLTKWQLKANKFSAYCSKKSGTLVIGVKLINELMRLHQDLIKALSRYIIKKGTAKAFFTLPNETDIKKSTIEYVANFIQNSSGKNFYPHLTVGRGSANQITKILAMSFDSFIFSPISLSIYQLGNHGTARKKLKKITPS